jgi:hypothetical protein
MSIYHTLAPRDFFVSIPYLYDRNLFIASSPKQIHPLEDKPPEIGRWSSRRKSY